VEATDLEAQALRYNSGKRLWHLVDYKSLEPMIKVLEFGAEKYSPDNWKKGMPREQLLNSAMRHLVALMDGEVIDSESGLPHIGHLMCNAMFISFFEQGLGSEKAMEFFNGKANTIPDSLKQYPVTIEEAYKQEGELLKAPEGYVFVDREQYQKVRYINDLSERVYDFATKSWYLNDAGKTDWVCNLLTNKKGLVAIPMGHYLNYVQNATT
jgi:hypothetical protein